ncbi:MAG TPA: matrixin family metalloprotease [Candidatus Polarisedimenticolia bacterium]|nr:matrixin family metalloprotease [Candidatus Polarisedimenticolia bacterium]
MNSRLMLQSVIIAAAAAIFCPPVPAATYAIPADDLLVAGSDTIVRGWISSVESHEDPAGGLVTRVRVEVDRTLKGTPSTSLTFEQPGGRAGDRLEVYPGIGEFTEGEEVLLMLQAAPGGAHRLSGFALGKFQFGRAPDGTEYYRRDGLRDAMVLGAGGALVAGVSIDPDRDALLFERYIEAVVGGLDAAPDYLTQSSIQSSDGGLTDQAAGFTFLGSPAHWIEFAAATPVIIRDNATGDAGSNCPTGCHTEVSLGVTAWNHAPGAQILMQYGGTDSSVGNACVSALDNRIQFNDPCGEISNLVNCAGVLALGGYSASSSGGGSGCGALGTLTFGRIVAGRILVNNGVGSCLNSCNYRDMIAHETGHMLGAGHSAVGSALMAPSLVNKRCGALQADDIAFSQCAYEGTPSPCTSTPPFISFVTAKRRDGAWRALVYGSGFTKGAIAQFDAGSGFLPAPKTVFKRRTKLVARDVDTIWPAGTPVTIRVVLPGGCESNELTILR